MDTYLKAAKIVAPVLSSSQSVGLKTAIYSGGGPPPSKAVYATVVNTVRNHKLLLSVIKDAEAEDLLKDDVISNQGLLYVLVFELLLGPYKTIRGGG